MIDEWKKGAKYWDHSWNPVIGCRKVSEGCANCYAARTMERFGQSFEPHLSKRQTPPKSGVVFVGNMTDLFGEWNDFDTIAAWLNTLHRNAVNLILTKRAERMFDYGRERIQLYSNGYFWGITAENQERLEERLPVLFGFRCRWLSLEPLLGPIDFREAMMVCNDIGDDFRGAVDWVVVGAESGPNRRPCKFEWVESIVLQCREAGIPVFVKQLEINGKLVKDINKFPPELQIRQVPWRRKEMKDE